MPAEKDRLLENARREKHWRRWGPYLSERAWGTVREDYSARGEAWTFFPHDDARSRAYRWGEDGLCGICDNHQRICFALALWNRRDPILKERLFGLTGLEGNHGEDVKEIYYYLDATPTNSWLKCLYKYPQGEYPYAKLVHHGRNGRQPELELLDLGLFDDNRYFDVFAEYAKADANDMLIRITIVNRGPERAPLDVLPTVWFRNTWSWFPGRARPVLSRATDAQPNHEIIVIEEPSLGHYELWIEGAPKLLFTENESNTERLWGYKSGAGHYKDAFHEYVIHGRQDAVNADHYGTKACAWFPLELEAGQSAVLRLRLHQGGGELNFDGVMQQRLDEADEFYAGFQPKTLSDDARNVQRQALAGMIWSRQYYHYVVEEWLNGDPKGPPPPPERKHGRNSAWVHLFSEDIISMPDKWEYPWFAAWDLAFHMIPFAMIDPEFAKGQLGLFVREWYMHPNGQIPAYEWQFSDVNPPVHAWAAWRVYKIDGKLQGKPDVLFLERVFHKLLMNFTWWVNRKDSEGNNIFEGGFLGLDNIGVFDRSAPIPGGGLIEQSDGTSWMAMYSLNMLKIATELAQHNPAYEDIASKFFEHFLYIAHAMNHIGGSGLWDEQDGFYYDRLKLSSGLSIPMRVRSVVGLIPLFAVDTLEPAVIAKMPGFRRRMDWFERNRPDLSCNTASTSRHGAGERRLLSVMLRERLERVLRVMFDEGEFLSPYGIRSLSRYHESHPYTLHVDGAAHGVWYEPAESSNALFGGNSNWRGPIWFPINYLIIESLQKYHHYFGNDLLVEFPTGGKRITLGQAAAELSKRLSHLLLRRPDGSRPAFGGTRKLQDDAHFRDCLFFNEYFHGDNGAGLGASHQTGWTGLVAKLLQQSGE